MKILIVGSDRLSVAELTELKMRVSKIMNTAAEKFNEATFSLPIEIIAKPGHTDRISMECINEMLNRIEADQLKRVEDEVVKNDYTGTDPYRSTPFREVTWSKNQKRRCGKCNGKGEIWRKGRPERCPECITFHRDD